MNTQGTTADGAVRLEGVRNFRDVGGLPAADGRVVRHGRYFRSGHLARPTDADREVLAGLGLRLVVDLRSPVDIELDGADLVPPGARLLSLPMSDPARNSDFWKELRSADVAVLRERLGGGRAEAGMAADYRAQVVERAANHATLLRTLVEADGLPVVVHCSAGKDRAGIAAALVLRVLGVPDDAIVANYLESNAPGARYRLDSERLGMSPEVAELFAPFLQVREEYLRGALEVMDTHWGGFDRYLAEGLGFGPDDQERLRGLMLRD